MEQIILENLPNLAKGTRIKIQEAQRIPLKINKNKSISSFLKDFIYLFDRERSQVGREAGRERGGSRLPAKQRA